MAALIFNSVSMRYKAEMMAEDSRFIAIIKNVSSEEAAKLFLTELKQEYTSATHICFAYVLINEKTRREKIKTSDAGEPQGSAGTPILNSIKNAKLANVCLAVVRFFGSSLLGIGPLTRAYGAAADKLIKNSPIIKVQYMDIYECVVSYSDIKKIEHAAQQSGLFKIMKTEYEEDVAIEIAVDGSDFKKTQELINKILGKKVLLKFLESKFV